MVEGISGVQIGPGAPLVTLIPRPPRSCARLALKFATAAFVAAYGASVGFGLSEFTEELPMIEAPAFMWGSAALHRGNIADRFVAIVRSHSSSGVSSRDSRVIWYAALFTSTSIVPNSSRAMRLTWRQGWAGARTPATRRG